MVDRRRLVLGALATGLTLPARPPRAQGRPRVVVIGGGPGGATAAKYLARDSQGAIDVVLVEPKAAFTTCFHSNLYLGGIKSLPDITHRYDRLVSDYGIRRAPLSASAIDRDARVVVLADGQRLGYDRLVLSPGIDLRYDSVPGWSKASEEALPHAWQAGRQTELLRAQLDGVPDGGVVVMIAPPNPYRCPPGPYERASMMAHQLKSTGRTRARIVIIDPKETFSKQALFTEGWARHYPGMIEWLGPKAHLGAKSVDAATMTVTTGLATYAGCALINVIPAQHAGRIALDAGLGPANGYCAINPETMKSLADGNIYILGDAAIAGDMPKSAFSANSQAKVAARMIAGELIGAPTVPARYANTCWSMIAPDDTVKVGGRFEAKLDRITATETFISKLGETAEYRRQVQEENIAWYAGLTADIFS